MNEYISKEHDVLVHMYKEIPTVTQLSNLYNIALPIALTPEQLRQILPRTKDSTLALKIVRNNIIITSLHRHGGISIFLKQKVMGETAKILSAKIAYTRGYIVHIDDSLSTPLRRYMYTYKLYGKIPKERSLLGAKITLEQFFDNNNYSAPVWLRNNKYPCKGDFTGGVASDTPTECATKLLKVLNHLNSAGLSIN